MRELTKSEFDALNRKYDLIPLDSIPDLRPEWYPSNIRKDKKGNIWLVEKFEGTLYGYINIPTKMLRECMGPNVKVMRSR